jgi:hypothetical protein
VQLGLESAVRLWSTPKAAHHGAYQRDRGIKGKERPTLTGAVMLFPTPTAMNNTGGQALCKWGGSGARAQLRKMVTPEELNGALNPEWVEWLMGYPIDHTALKASETPSSQRSSNRSSVGSPKLRKVKSNETL